MSGEGKVDSVADKARGGQVTFTGVGKHDDDFFSGVFGSLRQKRSGIGRSTGGNADQQAFVFRQLAAGAESICRVDSDNFIDNAAVKVFGDKVGADALDLVRAGLTAGQQGRIAGFDGDDLDARIFSSGKRQHR